MDKEDIPDINKADKATKRYFKNSIREIQEIDAWMETLENQVASARFKNLYMDKRSATEEWWCRFRHALLKAKLNTWQEERDRLFEEFIADLKELKQILSVNGSTDGQEPTSPSIKSDIDNNKSDDKAHQIIGSVETKTSVDDLLQDQQQEPQYQTVEVKTVEIISQVQQQQELQQVQKQQQQQQPELLQVQQIKSSDNTIKMIDIYEMEEKIKQSVINEIEGQIIKPDADYTNDKGTLDQEQMYANSVDKSDTFRGGTDFKLFNPSTIMFQQDDSKTMAAIMFGAQTAKQFQKNDQHQDDMKDNPISRGKRKTQKSVKFQIEEDKVIEAYVTHWQELEKQDRVQQGQELEQQDHSLSKYAIFIREDHNFRHGAVQQISPNTMPTISRHTVSWLAGV